MEWKKLLTDEIEANYVITDRLMGMVDEGSLDWKPSHGKNWMTTGQLLSHLTTSCGTAFKGFTTGDWGMPEGMDMEEMKPEEMIPPAEALPTIDSVKAARKGLAEDRKLALEILAGISESDLETKPTPAPWDPRPMPLGQRLLSMAAHLATHKNQLFYYLKLQGKDVNTYTLWSA